MRASVRAPAALRTRGGMPDSRMVRKLDLHEDAIFGACGPAVAIMGFEYAESARPIPVYADRCLRVEIYDPGTWELPNL